MKGTAVALVSMLLLSAGYAAAQENQSQTQTQTPRTTQTQQQGTTQQQAQPQSQTLNGEIVDLGCYMQRGTKGAQYQKHSQEAISKGMPMGLVTPEGKLYVLTVNESQGDAFNRAKTMIAQNVTVTGPVYQREGISAIEVMSVTPANTRMGAAGETRG